MFLRNNAQKVGCHLTAIGRSPSEGSMIPVPWVNHLAVGPGLPLSAPGESAPRPGAPELHFASREIKASLRAVFFLCGLRGRGDVARAGGCQPWGHAPATRGGRAANRGRLLIALRAGSAPHRRFPTRHPVSRKRSAVLADPLRASSGGTPRLRYRPRGRYPPALPSTEVSWGRAHRPQRAGSL